MAGVVHQEFDYDAEIHHACARERYLACLGTDLTLNLNLVEERALAIRHRNISHPITCFHILLSH